MVCAICHVRRPRRRCPGVHGDICAICCGTEREVTVSCPFECEFLQEAHKREKPAQLDLNAVPNSDIQVSERALEQNTALLDFVPRALLEASMRIPGVVDATVRQTLESVIRTWRTLQTGLYYESLPDDPIAIQLFRSLRQSIEDFQRRESQDGVSKTRTSDVLLVLAFFQRVELDRANGRPLGRVFLDMLWHRYGAARPVDAPSSSLILP